MINAPAGSGKTLLCVHMCLRFLDTNFASNDKCFCLFLVHSDDFAEYCANLICSMAKSVGKNCAISTQMNCSDKIKVLRYTDCDGTSCQEVHVIGVDTFVTRMTEIQKPTGYRRCSLSILKSKMTRRNIIKYDLN